MIKHIFKIVQAMNPDEEVTKRLTWLHIKIQKTIFRNKKLQFQYQIWLYIQLYRYSLHYKCLIHIHDNIYFSNLNSERRCNFIENLENLTLIFFSEKKTTVVTFLVLLRKCFDTSWIQTGTSKLIIGSNKGRRVAQIETLLIVKY